MSEQSGADPKNAILDGAFASTIEADNVTMDGSGAALVIASDTASLNQSGAAAIVSDGEAKLLQSGAAVVLTNDADVTQSFVGVLAARDVTLGPDTKVLATWVEAVVFGAVFGVVAALLDVALRGACRRR